MLARLSKTLSTHVAIGGLSLLVLGAGGTGASLAAGKSPVPTPNTQSTTAQDDQDDEDSAAEASEGTRPTDTHGYCVSQVAKAETTGDANHGAVVSAAAHACGKESKASEKAAEKAEKRAAKQAARAAKAADKAADESADDDASDDRAAKRQDGKRANR